MPEDTSPWAQVWDQALDLVSRFVTPAWDTLLQYIPLLLFALVLLTIPGLVWAWRRNAALNRSRVPAPLPAGPVPQGVHLPPGSIWPFIAPIGMFLVLLFPQGIAGSIKQIADRMRGRKDDAAADEAGQHPMQANAAAGEVAR